MSDDRKRCDACGSWGLGARVAVLEAAIAALCKVRCPACPGAHASGVGHDDRCWLGAILAGESGPAYDAACAAVCTAEGVT